jgi:ferrochelatase
MNALVPSSMNSLSPAGERVGVRGIILVNVGTPDEPTVPAVRRYLAEFLGDPSVIDLPAPARWLLLNLVILPFRPKKSTHAYQAVWTPQGSPLMVHSKAQVAALQAALPGAHVALAMRYGNPSLEAALAELQGKGCTHITIVPMYPQYASATTGTTVEAWHKLLGAQVQPPATSIVPAFYDQPGFLEAVAERIKAAASSADHVLFSYHGLPVRQVRRFCGGNGCGGCEGGSAPCPPISAQNAHCYRAQCFATTAALVARAGLAVEHTSTAFQSRLKGDTWLHPFTDEAVTALAQKGVKRLAVACPSFVADCLETIEEIGMRAAESFKAAGGESFTLIPAVNDSPRFITTLAETIQRSP